MTEHLTNDITNDVRYVRFNVTTYAASPATVTRQGLFEKRGWRKWVAILLRKPISEWQNLPSEYRND